MNKQQLEEEKELKKEDKQQKQTEDKKQKSNNLKQQSKQQKDTTPQEQQSTASSVPTHPSCFRFAIINVIDNTIYSSRYLNKKILNKYINECITKESIDRIQNEITTLYMKNGYTLIKVYVDLNNSKISTDTTESIFSFVIEEGRIGKIEFKEEKIKYTKREQKKINKLKNKIKKIKEKEHKTIIFNCKIFNPQFSISNMNLNTIQLNKFADNLIKIKTPTYPKIMSILLSTSAYEIYNRIKKETIPNTFIKRNNFAPLSIRYNRAIGYNMNTIQRIVIKHTKKER
jgi:hypothetical protein